MNLYEAQHDSVKLFIHYSFKTGIASVHFRSVFGNFKFWVNNAKYFLYILHVGLCLMHADSNVRNI